MDGEAASDYVKALQDKSGGWADKRHFMITTWRRSVEEKINAERGKDDHAGLAAIEVFLSQELPFVDSLVGIFKVDSLGLWFYDGDGDIEDAVWRQHLVPWHCVCGLVLHQSS